MPGAFPTKARFIRFAAPLLALVLIPGCAALAPPEPVPTDILSAETSASSKIRAIHASWTFVEEGRIEHGAMHESLKRAVWRRSLYWEVRTEAVVALLEDESNLGDTRNMLRLLLPTETHWQMIELICRTAGERGWRDLTASIVRSWSRPVVEPPDDQRPERFALEALYAGRSVEEVVFDLFAGRLESTDEPLRDRDRKDAWELLIRLDPVGSRAGELLSGAAPDERDDPIFADLRAAANDLGIVPRTREQLEWVQRLRAPENDEIWRDVSRVIGSLTSEQREGIDLRHVPVLIWVSEQRPEWLALDRGQIVDRLLEHQKRERGYSRDDMNGVIGAAGESIRPRRETIAWGDGLTALMGIEVMQDPELVVALFAQAERDKRDTTTEYGGLIRARSSRFTAEPHEPRPSQRVGDQRFVGPKSMIEASTSALFHYHFHATRHTNSSYAGPSSGDLEYADRFGAACLVFTFVSRDMLNVDCYFPDAIILDLGVLRRRHE